MTLIATSTALPNSALRPFIPDPPPDPGYFGSKENVTGAWNGGAYDPASGSFYLPIAGGHHDWYPNNVYRFRSGAWARISEMTLPTPGYNAAGVPNTFSVYADGKPCARHTYDGVMWLPTQRRIWVASGARWADGTADLFSGWYDPATDTWTRKSDLPVYGDLGTAWDAPTGRVLWAKDTTTIYRYDPVTDTHTIVAPNLAGSALCQLAYDWDRQRCLIFDVFGHVVSWTPIPGAGPSQPVTWTGDTRFLAGAYFGLAYEPTLSAIVVYSPSDPGAVALLHTASPSFVAAERLPLSGPVPVWGNAAGNGCFNRFQRTGPLTYMLVATIDEPVYTITIQDTVPPLGQGQLLSGITGTA